MVANNSIVPCTTFPGIVQCVPCVVLNVTIHCTILGILLCHLITLVFLIPVVLSIFASSTENPVFLGILVDVIMLFTANGALVVRKLVEAVTNVTGSEMARHIASTILDALVSITGVILCVQQKVHCIVTFGMLVLLLYGDEFLSVTGVIFSIVLLVIGVVISTGWRGRRGTWDNNSCYSGWRWW